MGMVGENIRAERIKRKMSQAELARRASWDRPSFLRMERGESGFSEESLRRIADALEVNIATLWDGQERANPITKIPFGNFHVPLLDAVKLRALDVGSDSGAVSPESGPPLLTDRQYSSKAFGMEILDVSMRPAFNPGDVAIFEPERTPKPNDFVVARNAAGDIAVRVYKDRGRTPEGTPAFDLVPLDDGYPTWKSREEKIVILGVWVERREYRGGA